MTSVKFFGQYLLLEGAVTMEQLREALQLMEREHKVLGQLAVDEKLLTAEQANEINQEQLNRDLPFGKLAIEQGLPRSLRSKFKHLLKPKMRSGLGSAKRSSGLAISMSRPSKSTSRNFRPSKAQQNR